MKQAAGTLPARVYLVGQTNPRRFLTVQFHKFETLLSEQEATCPITVHLNIIP